MKHEWQLNADGEIDLEAWDGDTHGGPRCAVCEEIVCNSCDPNFIEFDDCDGPYEPDTEAMREQAQRLLERADEIDAERRIRDGE